MPTSAGAKKPAAKVPEPQPNAARTPRATEIAVPALKAELLAKCTDLGVAAIKALPANLDEAPLLRLEFPDFLVALQAEAPKAVFWFESVFEPEKFVRMEMEVAGWSEDDDLDDEDEREWPTSKEVLKMLEGDLAQLRSHTGNPYFLMAVYSQDGVPRTVSHQAEWASALEDRVAAIMEDSEEAAAEQSRAAESGARETLERLAKEIAASAAFRGIRGLPKRQLWVEANYKAQIPEHPRGQVTRVCQGGALVDLNLATVVQRAAELAWLEANPKK